MPRNPWIYASSVLLANLLGCATATEIGQAAGEGALEGFYNRVFSNDGSVGAMSDSAFGGGSSNSDWGTAWEPSGRGVGVAPRSASEPELRDCGSADEFALYSGVALSAVQTQVPTVNGSLTREKFDEISKSGLRLSGAGQGGVIGVAQTSEGNWARFVLQWPRGGNPQIVTVEVQNAQGQVVRSGANLTLPERVALDLDGADPSGSFDLIYGPAPDGALTIAAAEGAGLSFPTRSLCR